MPTGVYTRQSTDARFRSKVDRNGPIPSHRPHLGPCWCWTASTNADGYGRIFFNGRMRLAHVVAYILDTGHEPPTETPLVIHLCDNTRCVRPSHLKADTTAGNIADRVAKGRDVRGERKTSAKLTDAAVIEIRARYARDRVSQSGLAAEYGVTQTIIGDIVNGKRWTHIPPDPTLPSLEGRRPMFHEQRGERGNSARLTECQVKEIRARHTGGATQRQLATEYGIAQTNVSMIIRRKTWTHVP